MMMTKKESDDVIWQHKEEERLHLFILSLFLLDFILHFIDLILRDDDFVHFSLSH